jgi:hypothetical protein
MVLEAQSDMASRLDTERAEQTGEAIGRSVELGEGDDRSSRRPDDGWVVATGLDVGSGVHGAEASPPDRERANGADTFGR